MGCNQSTNPYPPPSTSSFEVEEIRYQITFLPNHEIIGEFGQKIIINPLNNSSSSSSSSSDMYKKEMKHNVYIKSIHPSVLTYCVDDHGMKVGDVIEKIRTDGPDGIEQDVIELNKTTNSLLTDERPITLTCSGKRYNKDDAMYWAWEKRKEYKKEFPKGTPLVCACEKGRFEDVKLLIIGHDVNGSNGNNNNNMTLKEYVNQVGKTSRGNDYTPLLIAAENKHFQIVKYLVEIIYPHASKVEKKYYAESPKGTPIVCACEKGRFEDVKLLIIGHDVNGSNGNNNNNMTLKEYVNQVGKDSRGNDYTPLMMAASTYKIKKYLIDNGADLHKTYKQEFPQGTPIVCACEYGRLEDVKLLITGYNDVNGSSGNNNNSMTLKEYVNQVGKGSYGSGPWTPLTIAAWNEHFQIIKYLIEQGEADPNIARSNGSNALHLAAYYNKKDTELIEFLLTNMSLTSINKKAMFGGTPLDKAYYNNSPMKQKIIDLIRSKGGKRASEL